MRDIRLAFVRLAFVLGLLLLGPASKAFAIDGTRWMELDDERKRGYIIGVIDAWHNFTALAQGRKSPAEATIADVVQCIDQRKLTYGQIYSAAVDYVDRRKDRREYNMAAVTWNTVSEMCKN